MSVKANPETDQRCKLGVCSNIVILASVGKPFLTYGYFRNFSEIIARSLVTKLKEEAVLKVME